MEANLFCGQKGLLVQVSQAHIYFPCWDMHNFIFWEVTHSFAIPCLERAGCPIGLTPSVSSEQGGVKESLPRLGLGQEVGAVRRPGVGSTAGERSGKVGLIRRQGCHCIPRTVEIPGLTQGLAPSM